MGACGASFTNIEIRMCRVDVHEGTVAQVFWRIFSANLGSRTNTHHTACSRIYAQFFSIFALDDFQNEMASTPNKFTQRDNHDANRRAILHRGNSLTLTLKITSYDASIA